MKRLIPVAWRKGLIARAGTEIAAVEAKLDEKRAAGEEINPSPEQWFRALKLVGRPSRVRCIIVGQDPYPDPDHANGLAFAVNESVKKLPPSLRNVLAECHRSLTAERDARKLDVVGAPPVTTRGTLKELWSLERSLENWAREGVLLINSKLTTQTKVRRGHKDVAWEPVVRAIIKEAVNSSPNIVALLWGSDARKLALDLIPKGRAFCTSHPSPLGAYKGSSVAEAFVGSVCFWKANQLLLSEGRKRIQWEVDGALGKADSAASGGGKIIAS